MTKYFCDRCGEEVDKYSETFQFTVQSPVIKMLPDDVETGTYILCRDCVRELNKFMERKAKKL